MIKVGDIVRVVDDPEEQNYKVLRIVRGVLAATSGGVFPVSRLKRVEDPA